MSGKPTETELAATTPDPFDELLRQAAAVSGTTSRTDAATFAPGTALAGGRLSIQRRIGQGGMGVVYEAFDADRNVPVALKTLSELGPSGVYRLKNEFRSLAGVTHPNLVALHELFADRETWFFTMDLVAGERFDDWVRPRKTLDLPRLRAALSQLLAAIDAIHAAGKLHRDLKPANVLVTPEGRVVVLDFGLAIDPEPGSAGRTVTDQEVSGTPAYMAPEQSTGEGATAACDLYAVGVMLFEALTGRLPFEGRVHEILVDKQRSIPPSARSLAPDAPEDLTALCADLLARDPAARPTSPQIRERLGLGLQLAAAKPSTPAEAPPILGRATELAQLQAAFDAATTGQRPVVVLLAGESGIGKSALLETFLGGLRAQGRAVVLAGRCFERESVPFKGFDAIVDELSRYLRRLPSDQVNAHLPRDASALRRLFPVLGRLEAIAAAPERDVSDARELRRRAFLALGELFGRIRDRQPLVLHVDDLQWSDADSTVLWMHLVRQPDAPRLLLIASHRSEEMDGHPYLQPLYDELSHDQRLDVRRLRLGPLAPEATRELLERQLGQVSARLVEEAAGNPFLASELALHAAQNPGVTADGSSLLALVAARAAALRDADRALLELLAVAGRPIALPLVAAAAETPSRSTFESLRAARLVRSTGDGSRVECFHDKIREAVVQALAPAALRERHATLARTLRGAADADPEQIAGHLLGAGESEAAPPYWVKAAERASRELGFERAARLYALALEHGRFDAGEAQRIRMERAEALAEAGAGAAAAEAFLEAARGASAEDALAYRQRAAEQLVYAGELERGRELFGAVFRELGMRMPGSSAATLASIVYHDGRLRLSRYRFHGAVRVDPQARRQIDALRCASNALLRVDPPRGIELGLREALLGLQCGSPRDAAMALARQVLLAGMLGADEARYDRIVGRAEELIGPDDIDARGYLAMFRGASRVIGEGRRDVESAVADLRYAIDLMREHAVPGYAYHHSLAAYLLAVVRATAGELAAVAMELPARLDEAWNRNDLTVLPLWVGVYCWCGLATEDLAGLEHAQRRVSAVWSAPEFTTQELNLEDSKWHAHSYRGDWRAAFDVYDRFYARLMRSPMRRTIFAPGATRNRGLAAAALAKALGSGAEHDALVALVERIARTTKDPSVRAALACLRGDATGAVTALRAYVPHHWSIENYAMQRRLGALIGGGEGAALVADADAFFRAGGVVDPARYAIALAPGLAIGREE